jgi:hypothetical protein
VLLIIPSLHDIAHPEQSTEAHRYIFIYKLYTQNKIKINLWQVPPNMWCANKVCINYYKSRRKNKAGIQNMELTFFLFFFVCVKKKETES